MKSLVLGLLLIINIAPLCCAADAVYPSASGYVVDQSGIIDSAAQSRLSAWILELKQKTNAEVAVVTVDTTEPLSIEEYAVHLFQRFGIGQKGKDNGVLLLIAYKDHQMRIEVGYGLEGAITDAYSSRIIRTIITPEFKQGNFSEGIEKGTAAIVTLIAKEYNVTLTGVPEPSNDQTSSQGNDGVWLIVFFVIIFISFRTLFTGGLGGVNTLGYGGRYGAGGYSSSGGFGGGGGGFSGGFGGGMSGGGGASGGW